MSVKPLYLWYKKPAEAWEEALPLGNGRLGMMVFGRIRLRIGCGEAGAKISSLPFSHANAGDIVIWGIMEIGTGGRGWWFVVWSLQREVNLVSVYGSHDMQYEHCEKK